MRAEDGTVEFAKLKVDRTVIGRGSHGTVRVF
jgi:hypothetical protein